MYDTVEDMARCITSSPNWDGCDYGTMLATYTEEQIAEIFDMLVLDDEDDWR